jgi:Uncharacterized protein conserved in bacteria (DUF2188)
MAKGDVETYHEDGKWANRIEGESSSMSTHDTKEAAVAAGRSLAEDRRAEHIIKNLDGTISEKNSHGHDPRNIPG